MTDVSSISEFELIRRLEETLETELGFNQPASDIIQAIGDDAAIIQAGKHLQVITTDTMVEGVHFIEGTIGMRDLGWKSLAVNYSDIAAMGGVPSHSLITLGLPPYTRVKDLEDVYKGFADLIKDFGGAIVGGDIVRSDIFFVSVTAVGKSTSTPVLRRDAANNGDLIAVTGPLGCSAAGLKSLTSTVNITADQKSHFLTAHFKPVPRVKQGIALSENGVVASMDISDGLLADIKKICDASKVGANLQLDLVPVDFYLKEAWEERWDEFAVTGGEDYELLFTFNADSLNRLNSTEDLDFTVIGEITGEKGVVRILDSDGAQVDFNSGGWDHFQHPG